MLQQNFSILIIIFVGVKTYGEFNFGNVKNKVLHWNTQTVDEPCPSNGREFQYLLNVVCSTAQASNITLRDACITCFSRITSMPEGPQELGALSVCATQYLNSTYSRCVAALMRSVQSNIYVQVTQCYMGYCDFVHCIRRRNAANLIIQCSREARTGINLTLDNDNSRFYKNVTSCILAKARCGAFNPITGEPQIPGYTASGARVSNALQISDIGGLKILSFPASTAASTEFCTLPANLTQTNWLTNVC